MVDKILNKLWKFLIWLDVQVNDKWLGGKKETISSRCYSSSCKCCKWLCRMLDKVDPKHCEKAWMAALQRELEARAKTKKSYFP